MDLRLLYLLNNIHPMPHADLVILSLSLFLIYLVHVSVWKHVTRLNKIFFFSKYKQWSDLMLSKDQRLHM